VYARWIHACRPQLSCFHPCLALAARRSAGL
jgi:hypothetical protein